MGLFGRMMAYGAYYTASETLARPGRCQGLSFFASRSLFVGGMAFGTSYTAGGDARAPRPTPARPGGTLFTRWREWVGNAARARLQDFNQYCQDAYRRCEHDSKARSQPIFELAQSAFEVELGGYVGFFVRFFYGINNGLSLGIVKASLLELSNELVSIKGYSVHGDFSNEYMSCEFSMRTRLVI